MTEAATGHEIVVNGDRVCTSAATLSDLVAERGLAGVKVATAVNGHFVPERARTATMLEAGDEVEIVSARQGG